MDKKIKIALWAAISVILVIFIAFLSRYFYMHHRVNPGMAGLSKFNVGVLYCSHNDEIPTLIDMIKKRIKVKTFEIIPLKPYPKDSAAFKERLHSDNADIGKVTYFDPGIDISKFGYIIVGTSVMEDRPCPALQKYLVDHQKEFEGIPISVLVLYKKGEIPANTVLFLKRKLYAGYWKPPFVTTIKNKKQLNDEFDLWFNEMQFERQELK